MRCIFCANKRGKSLVGRNHFRVNRRANLLRQPLLLFGGDVGRILLCRKQEGIRIYDALTLSRNLLEKKADRHKIVLHARAKHFSGLAERARNLTKPRYVVFIVLDRIERNRKRQIGNTSVDAVKLINRHLVFFQIEIGDTLLEDSNKKVVGKLILVREAVRADRIEPAQEAAVRLITFCDGSKRVVAELVVISIIAVRGRASGKIAQVRLVLLVKESVLRSDAISNRFGILRKRATAKE